MHWNKLSIGLGAILAVTSATAAWAAVAVNSSALRGAVNVAGMRVHQTAWQGYATANGNTRASGTQGHELSAEYVIAQLDPGYFNVTEQRFDFPYFQELSDPVFDRVTPAARLYNPNVEFGTMDYSGSGEVGAVGGTPLQKTNDIVDPPTAEPSSTSGCEAADFTGFTAGNVALIQRGSCTFEAKAQNAVDAGASAVIIFNEGNPDRTDFFTGTLGRPFGIPVISTSWAVGNELADLLDGGEVKVHIKTHTISQTRNTVNVIAETRLGRADRVVVAGAHLDSVAEGPGIQDNGSGSAAILEIALQMDNLGIRPRNKVRFIWFGAEESGLLGSEYYVAGLSSRQIKNIAVNLNFDMIASPNFVPFVYDGDGSASAPAGPNGSKVVEQIFVRYLTRFYKPPQPTAFDGRSDYGPFIAVGIPAGGLFTGAEGVKTQAEEDLYGGVEGQPYDPCYHQACDDIDNTNDFIFEIMADAVADAVLQFAMTTSAVNGTAKGGRNRALADSLLYRGSLLRK